MIRTLVLALGFATTLTACRTTPDATATGSTEVPASTEAAASTEAPQSPAQQFVARDAEALVVDVRTPAEYASGHVAGARNVNVNGDGFEDAFASVSKDQTVYVYCRSGSRSARAKDILEGLGFQTVVNAGGFDDLAAAGAETE